MARVRLIFQLAWRHLIGHRRRNFFTAVVLSINAMLLVVGHTFISTVQSRVFMMMKSTMLGDFQIYSTDAKDSLSLTEAYVGNGAPDVASLDFPKVKASLAKHYPEVERVVPMGTLLADVCLPNTTEVALNDLRTALEGKNASQIDVAIERLRSNMAALTGQATRIAEATGVSLAPTAIAALERATSDAFAAELRRGAPEAIELVEEQVLPLAGDTEFVAFPTLGTDFDQFRAAFGEYKLILGDWVPSGTRGALLTKVQWDLYFKLAVPREFDRLFKDVVTEHKVLPQNAIAGRAKMMVDGAGTITRQLEELPDAAAIAAALKDFLKSEKTTLGDLMTEFLDVKQDTLAARYAFYSRTIVPKIRTHRIMPGDELHLRAWGLFPNSVILKLYGVVEIPAYRKIIQANLYHFIDLVSFRVLDGELTPEMQADFDALDAEAPTKDVDLADADSLLSAAASAFISESDLPRPRADVDALAARAKTVLPTTFDATTIDQGRVEHAAVFLSAPRRSEAVQAGLGRTSKADGVPLQVGGPAQTLPVVASNSVFFVGAISLCAIIVVALITLVSLLAISILVLGRTRELGILRAIGAPPRVIASALLLEMSFVGVAAGVVGAALGVGMVQVLATQGIPATNDGLIMIFAGPRLYLEHTFAAPIIGLVGTILVSLLATLFPARLATRVEPIIVMK